MLRISMRYPLGHVVRVTSRQRPALRRDCRLNQSTYSGGGRSGGGLWLVVGTVTAATAGTAVYAKYDPSFRKLIEENVPYSDSFFSTTADLIDQVSGLLGVSHDSPAPPKEKVVPKPEPQAPVKPPTPVPKAPTPAAKPAEAKPKPVTAPPPAPAAAPESLMKKKLERDAQASSSKALTDLKAVLDTAAVTAAAAHDHAAQVIRDLNDEMARYSTNEPNEKALINLITKNIDAEHCVAKAQDAAVKAKAQVLALRSALASSELPKTAEGVTGAQASLSAAEKQLKDSETVLQEAQAAVQQSQALQNKLADTSKTLQEELGPMWEELRRDQDLSKAWTRSMMLVALRMKHYKEQLAKHAEADVRVLVEKLGEDGMEERVKAHLASKEEELRLQLDQEYQTEMLHAQEECERRTQSQLQQQANALMKEKAGALMTQRAAFSRELAERMGQQQAQYTQHLQAATETLRSVDNNLNARLEKISHGAELLAMSRSCDQLVASLGVNPFPVLDWSHQRRAIEAHVTDVKRAFHGTKEEPFVAATLSMLPSSVVSQGVLTEPALKARFHGVERVARRVAMIREEGRVSLYKYLLSYLRSALLIHPVSGIKPAELANEPADVAALDNDAILDRARYFVDQGELSQAVRYLNLLAGPAQHVASGWMEEARGLLAVQHVARTLAAYASLLVQEGIDTAAAFSSPESAK